MSQSNDKEFFRQLEHEVERARTVFPNNSFMLDALVEEVGELARALMENERRDRETDVMNAATRAIFKEALQVACMAMRIATEGSSTHPHYIPKIGDGTYQWKRSLHGNRLDMVKLA